MNDLASFKLQIFKYTLIASLVFEIASLPVLRFSVEYLCGLLAGTLVSLVSFVSLVWMSEKVLNSGQKWLSSVGYLLRLPIYGFIFLFCYKVGGIIAGIACLIGFLTGIVAMVYVSGIKTKFSKDRKVRPEVIEEFEREDREKEEKTWGK